jgi:hypothetical protein
VGGWWYGVLAVLVVVLLGMYASWTAGRIDRLHHRVAAARSALDAELAARATLVHELAGSGTLDPASALLLVDAAHRARTAPPDEREHSESVLTRTLAATLADPTSPAAAAETGSPGGRGEGEPGSPGGRGDLEPWRGDLGSAGRRVQMARRFHNDIVSSTRDLRDRRLVRWLHLAGHAPMPQTIELDDGT